MGLSCFGEIGRGNLKSFILPYGDSATADFVIQKETVHVPLHSNAWFAVDYALPVPK